MIKSLIVEDDSSSYEYLQAMLERHFPEVEVLETVETIPAAIERVKALDPQLIFLDIELPPFTGFNLLEETRGMRYHTIFTTNFNKYAIRAFKFSAVHYLEKPFGLEELSEAIQFYKERTGHSDNGAPRETTTAKQAEDVILHNLREPKENHIIGFPVLGGVEFCPIPNIIRCKAENNYTDIIMTEGQKLTVTKTLKKVEMLLSEHHFYRVHRSYLVNLDHLKKYVGGDGGCVVMSDGYEVDVARNKKEDFLAYLNGRDIILR